MGCDARCIATAQQAPPSKGFVYVATGEGYVREARISAVSLRTHHPSATICLITDDAQCTAAPPFDHVIVRTDVNRNTADRKDKRAQNLRANHKRGAGHMPTARLF